jgi:hypothetical protein
LPFSSHASAPCLRLIFILFYDDAFARHVAHEQPPSRWLIFSTLRHFAMRYFHYLHFFRRRPFPLIFIDARRMSLSFATPFYFTPPP